VQCMAALRRTKFGDCGNDIAKARWQPKELDNTTVVFVAGNKKEGAVGETGWRKKWGRHRRGPKRRKNRRRKGGRCFIHQNLKEKELWAARRRGNQGERESTLRGTKKPCRSQVSERSKGGPRISHNSSKASDLTHGKRREKKKTARSFILRSENGWGKRGWGTLG